LQLHPSHATIMQKQLCDYRFYQLRQEELCGNRNVYSIN